MILLCFFGLAVSFSEDDLLKMRLTFVASSFVEEVLCGLSPPSRGISVWKREMCCRSGLQFDVGEGVDSNDPEELDSGKNRASLGRNALRAF